MKYWFSLHFARLSFLLCLHITIQHAGCPLCIPHNHSEENSPLIQTYTTECIMQLGGVGVCLRMNVCAGLLVNMFSHLCAHLHTTHTNTHTQLRIYPGKRPYRFNTVFLVRCAMKCLRVLFSTGQRAVLLHTVWCMWHLERKRLCAIPAKVCLSVCLFVCSACSHARNYGKRDEAFWRSPVR